MKAELVKRVRTACLVGVTFLLGADMHAQTRIPNVPSALNVPEGQTLLLSFQGKGSQIYTCQGTAGAYAWKLKAPEAKLFDKDGQVKGRHFAGPTWEADDGSRVTGKLVASVPSPDGGAIPWLLLTVASREGSGLLAKTKSIQRLDTKGGIAPMGACDEGNESAEAAIPYEAVYYFYGEKRGE